MPGDAFLGSDPFLINIDARVVQSFASPQTSSVYQVDMSKKLVSWKFYSMTAQSQRSEGLLFDSTFFIRKAQALLRFADVVNDPAIEDRMRENAAHCHSQAELLSDDEEHAKHPLRAVSQAEQLQLDDHLELEDSRMFQISFFELDGDGRVVVHWPAQPLYGLREDAVAVAEFDALRLSAKGSYDRDPDDCIHLIDRAGRRLRIEVREVGTVDMAL